MIPLPTDPGDSEDDPLKGLKDGIATARGEALFAETTASGWDEGRVAAPQSDWKQMRIGPAPDESFVALRKQAAEAVASACSIPVALLSKADGTSLKRKLAPDLFSTRSLRSAASLRRRFPMKMGVPGLRLLFTDLWAYDTAGRARSLQLMVASGMELERALALSGLLIEDDQA